MSSAKRPAPVLPDWLQPLVPFERYLVDVGDEQMHVMESGDPDGRPVVLLHGNPTWGFLYRKVAQELRGEPLRVIMPDLVGFGFSSRPPRTSDHHLATHADWFGRLLDALDLTDLADRKVSALSGGQRRRLDVAMGLVHAPPLLFLDEPSTGLDPQNRANLWQHVLRMRAEHDMTVVLTTHYLDEADTVAERVVVVDHGEVIADDTAEALKADLAGDLVVLEAADLLQVPALVRLVEQVPSAREVGWDGASVRVRVGDGPRVAAELVRAADHQDVGVVGVQVQRPTLDDVFLALTGRSLREEGRTHPDQPTTDAEEAAA